jgi:hypothetical protein
MEMIRETWRNFWWHQLSEGWPEVAGRRRGAHGGSLAEKKRRSELGRRREGKGGDARVRRGQKRD